MRLAASLRDPGAVAAAQAAWRVDGSLRLAPFLDDEVARAVRDSLRVQPHGLTASTPPGFLYQYEAYPLTPEADCDHLLCQFGRWLWSDGVKWIAALTGVSIHPPTAREVVGTVYRKGSYLDPHNDYDGVRKIAFIIGLTDDAWPPAEGGHLEFLAPDAAGMRMLERRSPGWNTLDLFDVRGRDRLHQVPLLTRDVERRTIAGWFV